MPMRVTKQIGGILIDNNNNKLIIITIKYNDYAAT